MAAIAIILFSCGNGTGTKNENNQDSTATTKNAVETQGINSFEFVTKLSQDKKFLNENLDKTVLITDLLVHSYEPSFFNEVDGFQLYAFAYNPNNKKMIRDQLNDSFSNIYNGEQIQLTSLDEKFKFSCFNIRLINPKQVKTLSFFDATNKYCTASEKDDKGEFFLKYNDLIKVKGTVTYDKKTIILTDAEIIK